MTENNPTTLPDAVEAPPAVEPAKKTKAITNKELQKNATLMSQQLNDVTDAVNALAEGQAARDDKLDNVLEVFSKAFNKGMEPMEQELGKERQPFDVEFDDQNNAIGIDKGLHDVDSPDFRDKMKLLEFMEEPVEVFIHMTNEKDADKIFDIQVNGRPQIFVPGNTYIVRRKFVDGLARAKPVHYENEEYMDVQNGKPIMSVRHPGRRGLRYPFTVVEDKNPLGAAWLKGVLAEP